MKRILIILAFTFVYLSGFGQSLLVKHNGKIVKFNGSTVLAKSWGENMVDSYLELNSHFTTYYAEEIEDYLLEVFDKRYQMPNDSANYYDVFGPNGLNKKVADWFHYVRYFDTLYQVTLGIPNTGETLVWQLDDSVYYQDNIPNHQIFQNPGQGLLTSLDAFSGVNGIVYMGGTSFTGELPRYQFICTRLYVNGNSYYGTVPNFENTSLQIINGNDQFFTEIEGVSNYMNSSLQQWLFQDNMFSQESVDRVLQEFYDFYSVTTPTRNVTLTIDGGSTDAPSASGQTNITNLESIFTGAGFTITISTN